MDGLALGVELVETTWEEHGAVQAAIERAQVVDIIILDLDTSQYLVPAFAAGSFYLLQRTLANLVQVLLGLLQTDE